LLLGHLADGNGAGDVGGSGAMLAAGIERQEFAPAEPAAAALPDPAMGQGGMRAGRGDAFERQAEELAAGQPLPLQRLGDVDLGQVRGAVGAFAGEPRKEPRQGGAVEPVRMAGAFEFVGAFDRLRDGGRIGEVDRLCAGFLQHFCDGDLRRR